MTADRAKTVLLCYKAGALRDAALASLGVTFLPTFLIDDEVREGRLQILFPDYTTAEMPLTLLYSSRRQPAKKVRLFIDRVATYLSR